MYLCHEIHDHHHDNQQRGSTEVERHAKEDGEEFRHQTDKGNVQGTCQCQACHDFIDILRRLLSGTNAWNKGAGFLQVVCCFTRVENQRRVEETEEDDNRSIQDDIQWVTRRNLLGDHSQDLGELTVALTEPAGDCTRKQDNAASKKLAV